MKLLTHNLVCCLLCEHFPLDIEATQLAENTIPENFEMMLKLLSRLNYDVLKKGAKALNISGLPNELSKDFGENKENLKSLHKLLYEVEIVNGKLKCEKCSREYIIKDRICNFILREDEVQNKELIKKKIKNEERKKLMDVDDMSMKDNEEVIMNNQNIPSNTSNKNKKVKKIDKMDLD